MPGLGDQYLLLPIDQAGVTPNPPPPPPNVVKMQVAGLVNPGWLVEIEGTAAKP